MKTNEKELYEAPLTMSLKFVGGGADYLLFFRCGCGCGCGGYG